VSEESTHHSLRFPVEFMRDVDELAKKTDDGQAWAKLMYGDWFVCRMSDLAAELEITLIPRSFYDVDADGDAGEILEVVCDNGVICDSCNEYGHRHPSTSLTRLILGVEEWADGGSREELLQVADLIESEVADAIRQLRERAAARSVTA